MLVLTRKLGEAIIIGGNIRLTVVAIRGNRVRLAITAPSESVVRRAERSEPVNRSSGQDSGADLPKK
jgi:carbon storage regulator